MMAMFAGYPSTPAVRRGLLGEYREFNAKVFVE
jgi:hypothetical protein